MENFLVEVGRIATGFLMIKREVIEKMIKQYPDSRYNPDNLGEATDFYEFPYYYALFDCGIQNNQYLSEDWLFCDRWRKMGGKVYADITISLSHTGTNVFDGRLLSTVELSQ